jgi:hypothetical protein
MPQSNLFTAVIELNPGALPAGKREAILRCGVDGAKQEWTGTDMVPFGTVERRSA